MARSGIPPPMGGALIALGCSREVEHELNGGLFPGEEARAERFLAYPCVWDECKATQKRALSSAPSARRASESRGAEGVVTIWLIDGSLAAGCVTRCGGMWRMNSEEVVMELIHQLLLLQPHQAASRPNARQRVVLPSLVYVFPTCRISLTFTRILILLNSF